MPQESRDWALYNCSWICMDYGVIGLEDAQRDLWYICIYVRDDTSYLDVFGSWRNNRVFWQTLSFAALIFYSFNFQGHRMQYDYMNSKNVWSQVSTGVEFNCMASMQSAHHVIPLRLRHVTWFTFMLLLSTPWWCNVIACTVIVSEDTCQGKCSNWVVRNI